MKSIPRYMTISLVAVLLVLILFGRKDHPAQ